MKLIDFDEKFNRKMAKMIEKHAADHSEDEWENLIAQAYAKFGDTYLAEIEKTPRAYFAEMSDSALVEVLKEYILQDIPVPDLLCAEIESRGVFSELLNVLQNTDEQLVHYALNLIGSDRRAFERYCEMLADDAYDDHVKDAVTDLLKEDAASVADKVLSLIGTENAPYAYEILSKSTKKDDRFYRALTDAYLQCEESDKPLYVGYLASYGDARSLPMFLREIEREDVGFVLYQELKFAIEALGGEYEKERDFSSDPAYKKIMAACGGADIFGGKKKN